MIQQRVKYCTRKFQDSIGQLPKFSCGFTAQQLNLETYEPGSILNRIVMSILLDQKLASENESISMITVSIYDECKSIRGSSASCLTVREILEVSLACRECQTFRRIKGKVYKLLRDWGFWLSNLLNAGDADGFF
jgi:hypothetical protein